MPRRPGDGLSAPGAGLTLAALALLVGVAGCETDGGNAGCQLTQVVVLADSPLTLLPDARLDRVGDDFVLIGSDGKAVRWASLSRNGVLGAEHAVTLPVGAAAPRFALAGTNQPADRVLVSYITAAANQVDSELRVIASAFDGSAPGEPGPPLVTFVGGVAMAPPMIEMGSSREGHDRRPRLVRPGGGRDPFRHPGRRGSDAGRADDSEAGDAFSCLDFSEGKSDLTFTYNRYLESAMPKVPSVLISEAAGERTRRPHPAFDGGHDRPKPHLFGRCLDQHRLRDRVAGLFGKLAGDLQQYGHPAHVLSLRVGHRFRGARPPAPVAGTGSVRKRLRGRPGQAEDLRALASERARPAPAGELVFPSLAGNLGEITAIQSGSALVATYADYTDMDHTAGRRVFLKAACY